MVLDALMAAIEVSLFLGVPVPLTAALGPLLLNLCVVGLPSALIASINGPTLGAFFAAICVSVIGFFVACVMFRGRLRLSGLILLKDPPN